MTGVSVCMTVHSTITHSLCTGHSAIRLYCIVLCSTYWCTFQPSKLYILFFAIMWSQDTFSSEDVTWNYCGGKMQIKGVVLRFSLTVHFHTPKSHWSWRSQHLQRWFAAHPCVWSGCSNGQTWIPGQAEKIQLKEICYFFFMSYTDGGQTNKR